MDAFGTLCLGLPRWRSSKESAYQCRQLKRCRFDTWVRKIPWRRKWQHTPVLSPGESHGQSSLASYSPWGCKEPDTAVTECAHMHTHKRTHTHITGLSQDLSMTSSSRELKMDHSYKED